MEIRFAQTEDEVEEAMEIINKTFLSYYETKTLNDAYRQCSPAKFTPERFIIALNNKTVVGSYRTIPKKMLLAGIEIDFLGGGEYCIDKSNLGNSTLGIRLYSEATKILSESSYPFGLGSTRRIMGNYFHYFGRIGIDTYAKCKLEKLRITKDPSLPKLEFYEKFHKENLDKYESLRRTAFGEDWGLILRTHNDWEWLGYRIEKLRRYRFFEIFHNDVLVGYFVIVNDRFVEYGLNDINFEKYAKTMVYYLPNLIPIDRLIFCLSPNNRLFQSLGLSNISYTMRYVPDEGISAIGYNKKTLVGFYCEVLTKNRNLSSLSTKFNLGATLAFKYEREQVVPEFEPEKMTKEDTQLLLNSLFLGTYGPFSLLKGSGPFVLPPTFFRINEIDEGM